jgi:hypothetical protein
VGESNNIENNGLSEISLVLEEHKGAAISLVIKEGIMGHHKSRYSITRKSQTTP